MQQLSKHQTLKLACESIGESHNSMCEKLVTVKSFWTSNAPKLFLNQICNRSEIGLALPTNVALCGFTAAWVLNTMYILPTHATWCKRTSAQISDHSMYDSCCFYCTHIVLCFYRRVMLLTENKNFWCFFIVIPKSVSLELLCFWIIMC